LLASRTLKELNSFSTKRLKPVLGTMELLKIFTKSPNAAQVQYSALFEGVNLHFNNLVAETLDKVSKSAPCRI
jgi:ATP-dependent protease Clp ATPase subunit